jgi:hypothetical protein
MALDPSISLGVRPLQFADPLAQYGQVASIQNAQNQNQLAQFQLGAAQRQDLAQNALSDAYKSAFNPDTNQFDENALIKNLAMNNAGQLIPDIQNKFLARKKELGQIEKTGLEVSGLRQDQSDKQTMKAILNIVALDSPEQALADINDHLAKGFIDKPKADSLKSNLQNTPNFAEWKNKTLSTLLNPEQQLKGRAVTTKDTDRGGYIERQTYDAQGMAVGQPTKLPKTQTFSDVNAASRLAFDQAKFAWEKANPGKTIQEDPQGFIAVDNRTGIATPVVYGPTGIQTAPAAPVGGVPGPRAVQPGVVPTPAAGAAATPTATPVAGAERVPGTPVPGKAKTPSAEYTKQAMGILNTNDALETMQTTMKNFKSADMLNPTRRAELGQAHAATLLFAKELFNLGVLNGGDERIINSVINNPIDFSSAAVPIEAIRAQAKSLQGVVDRTNQNLSTVYKLPPMKLNRAAPASANTDLHSRAEAILNQGANNVGR